MIYPFAARLQTWISRLQAAQPCSSQQTAHDMVIDLWIAVNSELGAPESLIKALHRRSFSQAHGWNGVGSAVAYWDLDEEASVRVYLHDDGAIVVQQMDAENREILFTQPGIARVGAAAASIPESC
ncbi:hypothetical protein [Comamonas sp.]|uniref:hypothetical protein n=1 Tax=Comamonas sp. TaxID=34028 RepID=UPI003A951AC2